MFGKRLVGRSIKTLTEFLDASVEIDSKEYHQVLKSLSDLERSKNRPSEVFVWDMLKSQICENAQLRRASINCLGRIGSEKSFDELIRELRHPHNDVNGVSAYAIGRIRDRLGVLNFIDELKAVDALKEYLLGGTKGNDQAMMAANAISMFRTSDSIDVLISAKEKYSREQDLEVHNYIEKLLRSMERPK